MTEPQEVAYGAKSHPRRHDGSSDISVHFGISDEEKAAVKNRGEKVLTALRKLGLNVKKGPVLSVLVSGGGLRADIACQGVLSELSHVGLLDMVTYLAGVSGSTWCMSSLYSQRDGFQDLVKAENELRRRLQEDSWKFSVALDGLCVAAERDDYSLTDFWSYSVVYYLTKELLDAHLSHVRDHSEKGTVPYPIFTTIDHYLKSGARKNTQNAWFEFTPDWVGYPTLGSSTPGAYVSTTHCGSRFEGGKLIQQKAERDFSYLRAVCGSALADKNTTLKTIKDFLQKFIHFSSTQEKRLIMEPEGTTLKNIMEDLLNLVYTFQTDGDYLPILKNLQSKMTGNKHFSEAETLTNQMMKRSLRTSRDEQRQLIQELLEKIFKRDLVEKSSVSSFLKFLWKTFSCFLSWTWGTTNNFVYKYGDIKDKFLAGQKNMYLMDAGLAINSAYPLVLPPVRNTEIILSFDFSEGDPFETIKATAKYCKACNIPFPPVDEAKLDQEAKSPSDFYIFEGENTPVIMHFPLFNKVNCGSTEVIEKRHKTYSTFHLKGYSDAEVCQLLEDSKANVRNNKDAILAKILAKTTS
ncbi:cytosolic phospholipase A2 gamma-like isoform X1 [Dromiciops gliroides]|uniref:cytosolic phospholipase A2 gamma-like isoform X1 n=1 Tax=Dromiciops gliroides TaxID=33562 RepID=UPI001CC6B01D|nr:cytosolic phospholipase A2 gamma-like isoform X1 [Dromiciops gliroides]XP_043847422.1 cytosolic phospholipase A2 gamma-like isoform X1 [Dromiciops gliroides]XP_043847423.1 cytosolic phospholipase A2 gamma-like isoform X1 [Dromiciops gliroides]XP_043847424.1 cytosolic phospholipase A2 gamma-like isoform X1 [Dromiciops gliroides]XP_043847425.1 cytosolic phospholipase A2 gamma-like isoform X1 [Dromiciops gliroides]XP_043847426.1 cytosolic phospholipase A2 gamma-like isoform X1 [Dromiciops glir